ncbi:MAG: LamG-like jellyroll fold domain-containing protein [Rhizomicrobium sp.]
MENWGSSGHFGWLIRHSASSLGEIRFFWSNDGSSLSSLRLPGAGLNSLTNQWVKICIEKNSSGKIRVYVNGVMKRSNTPANSAFHGDTSQSPLQQRQRLHAGHWRIPDEVIWQR